MKICAVVPLNWLDAAKSRLTGSLADTDRRRLVRWMAERVLAALTESEVVEKVAVVSPDPGLLAWARTRGAAALAQHGGGLNDGLELGRRWARAREAEALLVVLGDLALLTAEEVAKLVAGIGDGADIGAPAVVLAPDRASSGTNALLMRPATLLPFAFGDHSLARHVARARAAGVEPALYRAPGTQFDVDTPDDLAELRERARVPIALPAGVGGSAACARGEGA